MVTHSGIQVADKLIEALNEPYQVIVAKISEVESEETSNKELKVTLEYVKNEQEDKKINFDEFSYLKGKECFYLFIKLNQLNYSFFVNFINEECMVREKMLYASTQSNLLKEIGENRFDIKLRLSEKEELNYSSLVSYTKNEEENSNESTTKELITNFVDTTTKNVLSKFEVKYDIEVEKGIQSYIDKSVFWFFLSINPNDEAIHCSIPEDSVILDVTNLIYLFPTDTPSYVVYKYQLNETFYNVFIYSCPSKSLLKDKMLYSSTRNAIVNKLNQHGIKLDIKIEIDDPYELNENEIKERIPKQKEEDITATTNFISDTPKFQVQKPESKSGTGPRPRSRKPKNL
ncbi:actin depolymerizing protein [Neoconidiobolus thromboides FSU 785]|nr:actin depolymerizing protein [Neoconidiobolus thromboides FSU 785]